MNEKKWILGFENNDIGGSGNSAGDCIANFPLDYDYSTLKGGSSGIDIGDVHLMERISDSNSGEVGEN